ncbi:ribose operon repressor [Abditibacteriota bacterium]|nr:ribose operon repressor [Abditibacteriota bacterium]
MPRAKSGSSGQQRPKRVTLQDIAKVAGVHVMTVSDALNDTRSVAPATRERVKEIARSLNYIPNSAARALVTGRTGVIAILSGAMEEPYYANMVHALEKHLATDGYKLLLLRTPHEVHDLVHATGNTAVDGAIAIDMYHLVEEFRTRSPIPCVSIGTIERSFVDHVIVDLSSSVEEALNIMIAAGRKRIAYLVTAPHMAEPTEVRARTYLNAMAAAQQTPEIIDVDTDVFATVRERFRAYIAENGCPDALLCQNDETAMCAYRVMKDAGCRIPEDVLLVGCDGQLHMEYFEPPLSTIVQPMAEICAVAWQFLKRRIAQPDLPLQEATLQGELVVRPSLLKI